MECVKMSESLGILLITIASIVAIAYVFIKIIINTTKYASYKK